MSLLGFGDNLCMTVQKTTEFRGKLSLGPVVTTRKKLCDTLNEK